MKKKLLWVAPLAALIVIGAAPQLASATSPVELDAKPKAPRQCFWTRNANGFSAVDDRTVNVRVGARDVFQFEMFGTCPEIDWSQRIALVSRHSSTICSGMDAEIVTQTSIGPQRCTVRAVRKLTPAEVAALPKRGRP